MCMVCVQVVQLFKEAGKAIAKMPLLLLQPIVVSHSSFASEKLISKYVDTVQYTNTSTLGLVTSSVF